MMVIDEMAKRKTSNEKKDLVFMLAALCHDLGKPLTTKKIDGRYKSHGHEAAGKKPTLELLSHLTQDKELVSHVIALVCNHMKPSMLYESQKKTNVSDAAIRRLSVECLQDLILLSTADYFGRKPSKKVSQTYLAGDWLKNRAENLNVDSNPPQKLIQGKIF